MKQLGFLIALGVLFIPLSVRAQTPDAAPVAQVQAPAPDADKQKRIELATKMAELTPPRDTVEMAIDRIVASAPPEQKAEAKQRMEAAFDFDGFRQSVITSMAQTFTVPELQKMVEYHSSPEAKAIADKMPRYQATIQPEMVKMLDVALMVARTGKTAGAAPQ